MPAMLLEISVTYGAITVNYPSFRILGFPTKQRLLPISQVMFAGVITYQIGVMLLTAFSGLQYGINAVYPGGCGFDLKYVICAKTLCNGYLHVHQQCPCPEWQTIPIVISQHWFKYWLGAVRRQAILWTKVDWGMWCHTSLCHNELKQRHPDEMI